MKSLTLFLQVVLKDIEDWSGVSTTRDYQTITRRVEHEGISFLTISLAKFGKDLQKGLDRGFVAPSDFAGFIRIKSGAFPRLFQGLLEHVFDRSAGTLLSEPSITAIWALRQITLMWAKIGLDCTKARTDAAFRQYVQTDQEVREWDTLLESTGSLDDDLALFDRVATLLWGDCLSRVDRRVYEAERAIYPKHGPGATAERHSANAKWRFTEWPERLDSVFPAGEFALPNWRYFEYLTDLDFLSPGAERPVRVVSVPKTLESPRIIAIEPVAMQYVQQGLLEAIREAQGRFDTSRSFVGSEDQMPNRLLARRGSRDETLATLDLSEASDRVSNQLVRRLFRNYPHLAAGVEACRSRKADVFGHGVIRLAKFASMGSALTFAVEEMIFVTIIFTALAKQGVPIRSQRDLMRWNGSVRVFGDDIIVPVDYAEAVSQQLSTFGLKVNRDKSFWNGKFRESCGGDYYAGEDITITRMRSLLPVSRRQVPEIVKTVAFRNNCYKAGLWRCAAYLDDLLGKLIPFPTVHETSPVLGRHTFMDYEIQKMCSELHRPLVKGLTVQAIIPEDPLDDRHALLKILATADGTDVKRRKFSFSSEDSGFDDHSSPEEDWIRQLGEGLPAFTASNLEQAGRPRNVKTKTGWYTPY